MSLPAIHRVVTSHDAQGRASVASDGPLPTVTERQALAGSVLMDGAFAPGLPGATAAHG